MIKIIKYPDKKDWQELIKRPVFENNSLEKTVKKILAKVKTKADKAVRKFTKEFDGVKLKKLSVSEKEIKAAEAKKQAADNGCGDRHHSPLRNRPTPIGVNYT